MGIGMWNDKQREGKGAVRRRHCPQENTYGAYDDEAKEYDLPLVRQRCA
jgi:hypothetical protein